MLNTDKPTYAELEEENAIIHNLVERLSTLLTGVADALKGAPEENSMHSWHDLPELTEAAMRELNRHRAGGV